jgi:hypothetical protein
VKTPAEVLDAAFAALNLDDWAGFTDLCDPISLRAFKTETLDFFADESDCYHVDVDDLLDSEPDMPREVAEYEAAKMNRYAEPAHKLNREFLTVKSVDEIRLMDPARLFVLWLQARSPHKRLELERDDEQPWEAGAAWDPPIAEGVKETRGYRYSVIGSVPDGPDISHVLYRTEHGIEKIFAEEYAEWLGQRPSDEQELAHQLHHHATPEFAICRRQSDGSWKLVAQRYLMLVSSLQRIAQKENP